MLSLTLLTLASLAWLSSAYPYDEAEVPWNLNVNQHTSNPLEYTAAPWENHTYHPSPSNWRFPFYSFMVDRFVNGDPTNDDINGTAWEHDLTGTQLRAGGDAQGIIDSLDYLYSMGIRGLYLVGSPMINMPWESDQYSIVDHTILDHHLGNITEWRALIQAIHAKGMYVLIDNTMATMANQLMFTDFQNSSAPWSFNEHPVGWKNDRHYVDWSFGNEELDECDVPYPRFWDEDGHQIHDNYTAQMVGCRDSEFDQYGDIGAFDIAPEWRKQLSKFGGVQDRLREWKPSVRLKIEHFSCMMIQALDFDGFRMDKGMQISVDAQGNFSAAMRECARGVGKENFFVTGEIVSGNTDGAIYVGRGKEPEMAFGSLEEAFLYGSNLSNATSKTVRDDGQSAFDSAAFHYSIYRAFVHVLGVNGHLTAPGDTPTNFADAWAEMVLTNDFSNPNTGVFDPRHIFGVENQDTFRWSGTEMGPARHGLGSFIVSLVLPGIPIVSWGEEQAFYTLDSTAANYLFGRQPMSSSQAWQMHGCYKVGDDTPARPEFNSTLRACEDDAISLDHRDQSHPKYNIFKMMFEMRARYPVLNDGFMLQQLSNNTYEYTLSDANNVPTEVGLYSVVRSSVSPLQNFTAIGQGDVDVWMLYSNLNYTKVFDSPCSSKSATLAPFAAGTTVKNLFYPFDQYTLSSSTANANLSCVPSVNMTSYGFKAFVPLSEWLSPTPHITGFTPGHDARLTSRVAVDAQESVPISFEFSHEMDCDSVTASVSVASTVTDESVAGLDLSSVKCSSNVVDPNVLLPGTMPSAWTFSANLVNVSNGVHVVTIQNASTASTNDSSVATSGVFNFMFRIGQVDNPMVFSAANYSSTLLFKETTDKTSSSSPSLYIAHKASGADLYRYSTNWGSSWGPWTAYPGGNTTIEMQSWAGTKRQQWSGDHVQVQYWSKATGSSAHLQEGDLFQVGAPVRPRRFPHAFIHGPFNAYGYDAGLANDMRQDDMGIWNWDLMMEWPAQFQVNVWGINPDGSPDMTRAYGDIDNDTVLDRLSPASLQESVVNITDFVGGGNMGPPSPYLAWRIQVNDANLRYTFVPVGNRWAQLTLYILLALIPLLTSIAAVMTYRVAFYKIKFNTVGLTEKAAGIPVLRLLTKLPTFSEKEIVETTPTAVVPSGSSGSSDASPTAGAFFGIQHERRKVLIATIEYDIEDWQIKVKIGGLGVMAQLMGKNLHEQDLIWVVPCSGGIDYPVDEPAEPMLVTIMGKPYIIQVQYHRLNNITYVLLDAPIFRQQTKSDPYPARMDDLPSAIYYSAWNQCIAEAMKRFHVDLYHINDYHGTVAPLYLLPDKIIPCCLSLHNAEFQGLWPCRTHTESQEICRVFNLPQSVVQSYVQFGGVFNLLHAGASILRIHQDGFGAVGVSSKYGKRSYARYPIFWGLKKVGALPNPDPTDLDDLDESLPDPKAVVVDQEFEARRPELKRQAQEWANLEQRADADLFVFVGRWSMQKGIDLIADVFPAILEKYPQVQLLCVGPVIDLYGKFAALKLQKMMEKYPGRVYSKPEFTALPPFIFSGAEFALIPSRDEPFGLVAVEFGRKGALGVGARVGGLGQVPGWWYTIESMTTKHLVHQFKDAIHQALKSDGETRATMRARSAKTRFPVQQWKKDLEILQTGSIKAHKTCLYNTSTLGLPWKPSLRSGASTPVSERRTRHGATTPTSVYSTPATLRSPQHSIPTTREHSPSPDDNEHSMGTHFGPSRYLRPRFLFTAFSSKESSRNPSRAASRSTSRAASPERQPRGRSAPGSVAASRASSPGAGLQTSHSYSNLETAQQRRPLSTIADVAEAAPQSAQAELPPVSPAELDLRAADPSSLLQRLSSLATLSGEARLAPPPQAVLQQEGSSSRDFAQSPLQAAHRERGVAGSLLTWLPDTRSRSSDFTSGARTPSSIYPSDLPPAASLIRPAELELSLEKVLESRDVKKQQDLTPFFTDPTGQYYRTFSTKLEQLDAKTSERSLCIEEYLVESEKNWFNRLHKARMTPVTSRAPTPALSVRSGVIGVVELEDDNLDQFLLPEAYEPPTGLKKLLSSKMHSTGWPIYTFLLALGQILAANSYQVTLLTGQVGQPATKLYVVACIYLASSVIWWAVFRSFKSLYAMCLPWLFYGLAFFFLGVSPYGHTVFARGWIQNTAVGLYAVASSAGSFFFAQNFGSQGAQPVKTWGFRACAIQGTQQIYIIALWYWGSVINVHQNSGVTDSITDWRMTAITIPIAILLWAIGIVLFIGLPDFYRHDPGKIPSFYASILRRKIIIWFFVAVALQTYFLSATYGRNWAYLWSSKHAPAWAVVILIVIFFVIVWAAALAFFARESVTHSWILPIFAVGLGAPRWCQMLWSTSNVGTYLPWAGGPVASALLGRGLWLWLGVLDALQGVGFGMILLQTLTRFHLTYVLVAAQVIGSVFTILARATASNKIGPGDVFPDFSVTYDGFSKGWFWAGLIAQLVICVGFFKFFRKDQLSKP